MLAVTLVGLFLEVFLFIIVFINISKIKLRKSEALIAIFTAYILALLVAYTTTMPNILGLKVNGILIIIMTITANRRIKILSLSVLYGVITSIIFLLSGYALGAAFYYLYDSFSREAVINSWGLYFLTTIPSAILALCIAHPTGIFLNKKLSLLDNTVKGKLSAYILIGAIVTLILFFITTFIHYIIIDTTTLNMLYAITLMFYFAFLVFAIFAFADSLHQKIEISHKNELLSNLQVYTDSVEHMATEVRKFRHDHLNLMLGFHEYIQNHDIDKIQQYFQEYVSLFEKSTSVADSRLDILKNLKIPELKSIISFKVLYAQQLKIDVFIEVPDIIENTYDDILFDLCRITGILLDNAIEACQDVENSVLRFFSLKKDGRIVFVFTNTPVATLSLSKIFDKGFTTKEGARGLGLYSASQIIETNHKLYLNTYLKNDVFVQELSVLLK